jgi:GT2 family glycosyltransferase
VSVSVVVVSYDTGPLLVECVRSALHDGAAEVLVVRTGAPAPELDEVASIERVEVLSPGSNLGFAGGCNYGADRASGDVLFFLNPDAVVEPGALGALAATLEDPSIGIAMARLRLLDRPQLLNSAGNVLHLSGLAWAGAYGEPAERIRDLTEIAFASGAALAIRAELFHELGGFTQELFMYQEDLELSWRARLRGLRIVLDPRADVYHDYDFGRNPRKYYLLERNRLVFVLSSYSGRLLLLVAPVLAATEAAMLLVAWRQGWLRAKLAGWGWCLRHARWLLAHRKATQRLRRAPERDLAGLLSSELEPAMISVPPFVKGANRVVKTYWGLARKFL